MSDYHSACQAYAQLSYVKKNILSRYNMVPPGLMVLLALLMPWNNDYKSLRSTPMRVQFYMPT